MDQTHYTAPTQDRETAMRYFIIQQGHSNSNLNNLLRPGVTGRAFKSVLSVIMEIVMYLLFVAVIAIIFMIPSEPFMFSHDIGGNSSLHAGIHADEITKIVLGLKIILFIVSLPLLFCAIVLRKNRMKGNLIVRAFGETERMRLEYEKAFQGLRL
jgi:hypothetical protein